MVDINPRLGRLWKEFCSGYCKFRTKTKCRLTKREPGLGDCPIGIWWDLNDYLNDIKVLINAIERKNEE